MKKVARRILIAGGGTGGHLFPAVSIAERFMSENSANRILFVGSGRPLEVSVLRARGFEHRTISAAGFKGVGWARRAKAVFALGRGFLQACGIVCSFAPDLVIGMGGYSAAPPVFAAWAKGVPVALCEQNVLPGLANRLLARFADRIYVSFENTMGDLDEEKVRCFGNPVRFEILQARRAEKAPGDPFAILVLGGSQGAHAVNRVVCDALGYLKDLPDPRFIHQTGEKDESEVKSAYAQFGVSGEVKAFFSDMARVYERIDLAVCRSGATTVAELSALGIPAIFIPFPHAADDHQVLNAKGLCDAGAAETILERDLDGRMLAERIAALAEDPALLERMAEKAKAFGRPGAAADIVRDCGELMAGAGPARTGETENQRESG